MSVSRVLRSPIVSGVLLLLTFAFIGWALREQWTLVEQSVRSVRLQWGWIALASALVLATYGGLIQSWRMLLAGWGGQLPYRKAAQIWTVANLGRYLPLKVWSIGALGVLAAREGVSGVAAAGAAVLGTALNIGAGFGVALVFGAGSLDAIAPGIQRVAAIAAVGFIVVVAALPFVLPRILDRLATWRGVPLASQHLRNHEVLLAVLFNTLSWVGYGLAFACFSRGILPSLALSPLASIGVYAASYLVGYLVLFAPGGVGPREFALVALLVSGGLAGQGDATVLSATSRVWLTILEVVPGLVGLAFMSPTERAGLKQVDRSR